MTLLVEKLLLAELFRLYPDPERLFTVAYRAGEKLGQFAVLRSQELRSDAARLVEEVWRVMFWRPAGGESLRPRLRTAGSADSVSPGPQLVLEDARLPGHLTEPYGGYAGDPRHQELFRTLVEGALTGALSFLGCEADVRYTGEEVVVQTGADVYQGPVSA